MTPHSLEKQAEELTRSLFMSRREYAQADNLRLITNALRSVRREALEEAAKLAHPDQSLQKDCKSMSRHGQAMEIYEAIRALLDKEDLK